MSLAIGARSTSLLCPALIALPLCGEIIAPLCPALIAPLGGELRKLRTAAKQAHSCENCGATIRYRDDCQLERASRACLAGHFDFALPGAFCENFLLLQSKIISHCPEFIATFPMSCVPNFWPALERFPARPTKIPVVYRFCKRISMEVLSLWSAARS